MKMINFLNKVEFMLRYQTLDLSYLEEASTLAIPHRLYPTRTFNRIVEVDISDVARTLGHFIKYAEMFTVEKVWFISAKVGNELIPKKALIDVMFRTKENPKKLSFEEDGYVNRVLVSLDKVANTMRYELDTDTINIGKTTEKGLLVYELECGYYIDHYARLLREKDLAAFNLEDRCPLDYIAKPIEHNLHVIRRFLPCIMNSFLRAMLLDSIYSNLDEVNKNGIQQN